MYFSRIHSFVHVILSEQYPCELNDPLGGNMDPVLHYCIIATSSCHVGGEQPPPPPGGREGPLSARMTRQA